MIKWLLLFLFCINYAFKINGQEHYSDDSLIHVSAKWKYGDSALYRFSQTSNTFISGQPNSHLKKTSDILFKVVGQSDSGYTIIANFGSSEFEQKDSQSKFEIFNHLIKEKLANLKLMYFVNEHGMFLRWLNLAEFKNSVLASFDSVASDDFLKYNLEFEPLVLILKDAYKSDFRIDDEFLSPIKWFHFFYGSKLTSNRQEIIADEFFNRDFGVPIPAITITETTFGENTNGYILISGNTTLNKIDYVNWWKSFKDEKLATLPKKEALILIEKARNYDHKLSFNYKIDAKSGWIKQISHRESSSNNSSEKSGMLEFSFLK